MAEPSYDVQARLARVAEVAKARGASAVALVPGSNLRYSTGLRFHLSERPIIAFVTAEGELALIVPKLEAPQVEARPELNVRCFSWSDEEGPEGAFGQAAEALGLKGAALGVDGMTMRVSEGLSLQRAAPGLKLVPVEHDLIRIRAIKSAPEVAAMRRAIEISEQALAGLMGWLKPGLTELQIAARLGQLMSEAGSEGPAFTTTVLSGPKSALPHGSTGERVLQEGELLLFDFGATYQGYPADITRTFVLGEASAQQRELHQVVLEANRAATEAVVPGVPMGEIDRAARRVIEAAGYGAYFIHRTGHGLGLDVHEPIPQLAAGVTEPLQKGMMLTIEPGIYLPEVGGVRIEDDVLVGDQGAEVLTRYPRTLALR